MQVVSGAMGKEKVHYKAVKPELVKAEMDKFLDWFNAFFADLCSLITVVK